MDGAHPRPRGLDTALATAQARVFRLLGGGEHGLDAATGSETSPGAVWPDGATPRTHAGRSSTPAALRNTLRASAWGRVWRPQPRDAIEEAAEQLPRHRHLRHLEDEVAAVRNHLRADLDDLLPQRGQGPLRDLARQRQGPEEVGEVVR